MANSIWSYLQNPFDNVTKKSNKHMFLMATDHFDKLQARKNDTYIYSLYLFGKPFFETFTEKYSKINTDLTSYQMHTERFVRLLDELSSTLARRWDINILMQYDVVTVEYKSLLPNGRANFQNGAYDLRLGEVRNFIERLKPFVEFTTLRHEVEDFYAKIVDARTKQQGFESIVQMNSQELERARYNLAQAMHSIFGSLLKVYYEDSAKVETFYELKYLRKTIVDKNQEVIVNEELDIPQNKTVAVLENKLNDGDDIRVVNTGDTTLIAYTAPNTQSTPPLDGGYIVYSGQIVTFKAKVNDKVLMLSNDDENVKGRAFVELLE